MKTQHTPGPWKIHKSIKDAAANIMYDKLQIYARTSDGLDSIFIVSLKLPFEGINDADCARAIERYQANARLIAAAPELLDILNAMIRMFDRELSEETAGFRIISKAKEVIKKATE